MKKINFKILKEMDNKAFFKVEIPKSINVKETGVMLSLSTDTITIEHSLLSVISKEKEEAEIEAEIKSSLARSEPAFVLDNFIYLNKKYNKNKLIALILLAGFLPALIVISAYIFVSFVK